MIIFTNEVFIIVITTHSSYNNKEVVAMKPIIGIVGRVDIDEDQYQLFSCFEKIRRAIRDLGGVPICLLPTQNVDYYKLRNKEIPELTKAEEEDLIQELELCDGLLIPGGYRWFSNFDLFLARQAIKRKIPILGICAGMQVLAILNTEGQIIEKIPGDDPHFSREKYVHTVKLKPNTYLSKLLDTEQIKVNSRHRYYVTSINEDFYQINAYSDDGYIEGFESKGDPYVMAVQWHPESMVQYDIYVRKIIEDFILHAKKNMSD